LASPSDDGGFEELLDDCFNRASSSVTAAGAHRRLVPHDHVWVDQLR
jgi:hypothetical protein